jgi:hypothetical protein
MISNHISDKEGIYSTTATRLGIDNIPNKKQLVNMELVALKIFEPVREFLGRPIHINSFFRCPELNKAIGGSTRSQHCKGEAIDLDVAYGDNPNAKIFNYIKDNLDFDQLIWEFGDDNNPNWVHVSYIGNISNRNRCLKAYRCCTSGKTKYKVI